MIHNVPIGVAENIVGHREICLDFENYIICLAEFFILARSL
jgi:hypothetical protein